MRKSSLFQIGSQIAPCVCVCFWRYESLDFKFVILRSDKLQVIYLCYSLLAFNKRTHIRAVPFHYFTLSQTISRILCGFVLFPYTFFDDYLTFQIHTITNMAFRKHLQNDLFYERMEYFSLLPATSAMQTITIIFVQHLLYNACIVQKKEEMW